MTSGPSAGKDRPAGQRHGPRQIGLLVHALVRPAFRKTSPAGAQVMLDWPIIVGPALARSTRVRQLVSGTLTIGCSGPVALELQHLAGQVMERVNQHVGRQVVDRLRFVQERIAVRDDAPKAVVARPPVPVAGVPDGPLHDALGALGASIGCDRP